MEKKKTHNFGVGPWIFNSGSIENFALVTPQNMPVAIVLGRILYVIEQIGTKYMFRGTMSMDPVFDVGWWSYPFKPWQNKHGGHFKVYINSNMDFEETKRVNRTMINQYIENKELYIRPSDPILTYFKTEK